MASPFWEQNVPECVFDEDGMLKRGVQVRNKLFPVFLAFEKDNGDSGKISYNTNGDLRYTSFES